jgi:hypothetical protein
MAFGMYACSESNDTDPSGSSGQGNPSGTGGAGTGTSMGGNVTTNVGGSFQTSGGSGGEGTGGSCADVVVEANIEFKPADIIFVIDNSGSMSSEIAGIEQNINVNFASIIQSSGVDYQVIMVTDHGTGTYDVCVGPPLSNTTDCAGPPQNVMGQFYHYSVNVQSWDSVCKMFNTMFGPQGGGEADAYGLAPGGWITWLRPEAVKVFVEITDDRMQCTWQTHVMNDQNTVVDGQTAALEFDQTLLGLAPGQFGTVAARNYIFYSLVGMPPKTVPTDPYTEFEPVTLGTCTGGVSAGTGYQWLSKGTGALRFPMCQDQAQTYDVVFQDIAAGVIDVTSVPCEFDVPEAPPGQMLDLNTVDVLYTPGGNGQVQTWTKVDSPSLCGPNKFYIDESLDPDRIILCPQACSVVEADEAAKIEVKIECGFVKT